MSKYPYLVILELHSSQLFPHLFPEWPTCSPNRLSNTDTALSHPLTYHTDAEYPFAYVSHANLFLPESLSNMWVRQRFGLGLGIKANWSAGIGWGHGMQTKISWLIIWHDTGLITYCTWWVYKQQPTRPVKYIVKVVGMRLVDGTWTHTVINWSSEFCRII